jgi:MFS family permease
MFRSPVTAEERDARATLGAGLFSNGVWDMLSIVVPLYAVAIGLGAAEIGFVIAARSVLPTVLSIHGGILMDQLGTRRVLLWVASATVVLPLLYPVAGWFAVLVALQLLLGLASNMAAAGSQTWSMQLSRGDTAALARYSLVSRIGTFVGPVMVGATWDLLGAWAAFASVSLWGGGTVALAACASATGVGRAQRIGRGSPASGPKALAVLLPRWAEHRQAIALAAVPAVAFVLAASLLRNAPGAIQGSFYVVYLSEIGMSGTVIGMLASLAELFGLAGALIAAPMERVLRAQRLMILCIVCAIGAIAITPLIGHVLILLIAASAVRGTAQGISQPLVYTLLVRAVPPAMHGASVGLRNAVTRLASIVTPAAMGLAAEAWGIEASFYVIGALFVLACAALAVAARRQSP